MNTTTHPSWCSEHITEEDAGQTVEVHRGRVTHGTAFVTIEDSPDWPEQRPIVPPDLEDLDAREALDLALALLEAVRLVEWPSSGDAFDH